MPSVLGGAAKVGFAAPSELSAVATKSGKGRNKTCAYTAIAIAGQDIRSFEDSRLIEFNRFRVKAVNDEGD
jgi:hypothetical protein